MSEGQSKEGERSRPEGDPEEKAGFRVIDRRRFAPDGSEREADESVESPRPSSRPSAKADEPASAHDVAGAAPEEAGSAPDFVISEDPRSQTGAVPEVNLSTLMLSLSTQALMHLGEIPDLATGEPSRDLPAARSIIDLLAVLERKTRGNLDAAEQALLERILYDLRMRFVELSRA